MYRIAFVPLVIVCCLAAGGCADTELCEDPVFAFDGNTWTVAFNVMLPDGGVDEWTVTGVHDPEGNVNQILSVGVCEVKPAGMFFYPLVG